MAFWSPATLLKITVFFAHDYFLTQPGKEDVDMFGERARVEDADKNAAARAWKYALSYGRAMAEEHLNTESFERSWNNSNTGYDLIVFLSDPVPVI